MAETVLVADVPQQGASVGVRKAPVGGGWKKVQQGVLKVQPAGDKDADSFVGDKVLNVPSIIEQRSTPAAVAVPAPPRLAIMIHGVRNLPLPADSSSSSNSSSSPLRMYAKAAVHLPGHLPHSSNKVKTQPARVVQQGAVWDSLLSLSPEQPQQMMLSISLKHKQLLTNKSVVWGVATLPLSEVVASPGTWGERQQLQLKGHRLAGSAATLEVQLFLSTERISGPLSVLAATWNVGNALPPAVEQLREQWLRGAAESRHHLVVVGAQECNYTKDARNSRRRGEKQEQRAFSMNAANGAGAAAAAAAAAEPADSGGEQDSDTPLPAVPDASAMPAAGFAPPGSSVASVMGTSKAPTTLSSQAESLQGFSGGQSEGAAGTCDDSDAADNEAVGGRDANGTAGQQQGLPGVAIHASALDSSSGGALSPAAAAAVVAAADDDVEVQRLVSVQSKTAALRSYIFEQVDSAAAWERHISAALGSKYWLVQSKHMFQTRVLLFARVDVVPYISAITTAFEATGIGHVGLNKGGVAVSFKLDDTHLAFVSSHLAAHQSKTAQRNSDVGEICANLKLLPPAQRRSVHKPDLATGFHHCVWVGDLNYRLEYGQQAETHSDSPTPEDFASLCAAISAKQYQQLLQLDQLRLEQAAGRVFAGFSEGQIDFAPTFKVLKGEPGCSYGPKRSPAWCDRVLLKSALPHKRGSYSSYFAALDICTSDHKPVAAVLSLPLITDTVTSGRASARTLFKLYVAGLRLEGESTWRRLAELASHTTGQTSCPAAAAAAAAAAAGDHEAVAAAAQQQQQQQCKPKVRKLQLVLSGACIAHKHQHFLRVDSEAVASGLAAVGASSRPVPADLAAAVAASLTLREENMPLLPGAATDLQDDWLLLQLVLVEGLKQRTLARGIVPLQPVVAEYTARTFKAVEVPVQLECNSAAAGTAVISLQLISSSGSRQGMYEAIRRMRTLAMSRHMTSLSATEERPERGSGSGGSGGVLSRTMTGTLLGLGHKMKDGLGRMTAVRRPGSPTSP